MDVMFICGNDGREDEALALEAGQCRAPLESGIYRKLRSLPNKSKYFDTGLRGRAARKVR